MAETITGTPRFEMLGIRKAFGATVAVDGVDVSVVPGEVCAIVGQNGAGKSTLMAILSGALQPDSGRMSLDGAPYQPAHPLDARRAGVAMIYQELSLAPHLTVAENILLGMEPARFGLIRRADMRRTAKEVLERLGHPEISVDAPVATLSPAAQQLVEIGRALAVGCRVLVLDEPTSSLTQADTRRLFALIAELKRTGHAIVYISHFIEEVKEVADRIVVLRDGRMAGGGLTADLSPTEIVRLMVGRPVEALYPRSPRRRGAPILDVSDFGPSGATFTLHRGEILGIAGLLGAGRTRLIRGLFGLEPVRTGRVRLGTWSGHAAPDARWRMGCGMLSEDRKDEGLAATLSVADNMTLSRLEGLGPGPMIFPRSQDRAAARWMERLHIKSRGPRQMVAELSGGNQQKVAIARLLHHDVDVLLLDEPTRGVDVASKAQIYELIDELVSERRATGDSERMADGTPRAVLMISSYIPELLGLCDRIAVMCRGRLGEPRPVGELTEHGLMLAATGAGDA
jgi:ribose transport system ATP-binding protein